MNEKRRRARVQSGWASSGLNKNNVSKQNSSQQFNFQPNVQIKSKPVDIDIRDDGEYELSSTENGVSRIKLYNSFIPAEECDWMFEQLLHEIPWKQENIFINGESKAQPRLTAWYGDINYSYSGLTLNPYQFSPLLNILKDKVLLKTSHRFNSMLANQYRNEKDSVDWHSDDEVSLGVRPIIASLSFGDTRTFELRQKPKEGEDYTFSQLVRVPLKSGSLLLMEGATQIDWQHRVAKEYHDRNVRLNLTFRHIHNQPKT